ncbi:hypothetical protein ILUMI_03016 [Ignelater luminosus]|uniref:Uncharacterized protein n=1 Tax=Ignelater luminosus TaxID=2038154 RepID=A0A8K0DFE4_IGNLU|nr:hypothetical protein ILUMI_03016 [Ignelater luminosus]
MTHLVYVIIADDLELEEIVSAYEAEETDSENIELQSEESESDGHESAEDIIEDEIVPESKSDSEDDLPLEHLKRKALYGKNCYTWYLEPLCTANTRTSKKNIVLHLPGPKQNARNKTSKIDLWKLFFNETILDTVVTHTNEEILKNSTISTVTNAMFTPQIKQK